MKFYRLAPPLLLGVLVFNPGWRADDHSDAVQDGGAETMLLYAGTAGLEPISVETAAVRSDAGSNITVTYHDFPAEAKAAFEYATRGWEAFLISDAEILVDAYWLSLPPNVLGRSSGGSFTKDATEDAKLPVADVLYPAALANSFRGRRVDSQPDMRIDLSSNVKWYFGTDARTPAGQFDLVTVALHEIGQQLGIRSGLTMINGLPAARSSTGLLTIFDQFVVTGSGQRLADMFANTDPRLARELTGGNLHFEGVATRVAGRGARARLYAPDPFNPSSSVGHLDASTYFLPNDNQLMAPFTYPGWASHDPGPVALAILKDIGWKIAGQGIPTRLMIEPVDMLVWEGVPFRTQPVVTVADSVGAPVTSDNTTEVTLRLVGLTGHAKGSCRGESQTVTNGTTAFTGCVMSGWSWAVVIGTSRGLTFGVGNWFVVIGPNHSFLPEVSGP